MQDFQSYQNQSFAGVFLKMFNDLTGNQTATVLKSSKGHTSQAEMAQSVTLVIAFRLKVSQQAVSYRATKLFVYFS